MVKRYSDSVVTNTTAVAENLTNLMSDVRAEDILKSAVYYIDAIDSSSSGQTIDNLGTAKDLLPTTLGSSTAADSNDPKFLDHTGTNYVYTTGVNGNMLTVPNAANLQISGDIDLRVRCAADSWAQGGVELFHKYSFNGQGYRFYLDSTKLNYQYVTSGLSTVYVGSATLSLTNGVPYWLRVTHDVDNGAGGNDVKFFTSTDGVTWTQLGTTSTGGSTVTRATGTATVGIFGAPNGNGSLAGNAYRAQIYDGIDGTKVLDVDTSVITAGSATSFTAVTGQTVTINRSTSGRKTVAVTQPTWLFGTDDYMEVNNRYMSSGTYLYLPGVASNYASAPNAAPIQITGDIDLRVKVALDDWTPSATNHLVGKFSTAALGRSYRLEVGTSGVLGLVWTTDGNTNIQRNSTVAPTVTDGSTLWVRATLDVDNGAGGHDVIFYTSNDGTNWTQLGTTVTTAGTTSIYNSTTALEIGSTSGGTTAATRGKFFRAQVLNGIDGTVAFDANFETSITSLLQTSFTESSANAATVTINRSGSTYRSAGITTAGYLYPGATNTFSASATDYLNFGASDSFTVLAVGRRFENPAVDQRLIMKWDTSGYYLSTATTGNLSAKIDGTGSGSATTAFTSGNLFSANMVRNTTADTVSIYNNTTVSSVTDNTTTSLSNFSNFAIGRQTSGATGYLDAEIYAAAVFRRPLLNSEIALITSYFQRRDT